MTDSTQSSRWHEGVRALALSLIVITSMLVVTLIANYNLYAVALEGERQRLLDIAKSQASLISAVAAFDRAFSTDDVEGGAEAATLGQVRAAMEDIDLLGASGELLVARRVDDRVEFLAGQRGVPEARSILDPGSEPMKRALNGGRGTMVGEDYRGARVIAAYYPVESLDLGLVAKIDLREVQHPFIRATYIALSVAVLLGLIVSFGFVRYLTPVFRQLEASQRHLRERNRELVETMRERARLLERLQYSEERSRLALASTGAVFYEWRPRKQQAYYSDQYWPSLGYAPEEMPSRHETWINLIHPDDLPVALQHMERLERDETDRAEFDCRMRAKDGSYRWTRRHLLVHARGSSGEIEHLIAAQQDITAERDAINRIEVLATALEHMADAVMITDTQGAIEFVNAAFERTTGYTRDEVEGRNPRILKSGAQADEIYRELWKTITAGETWVGTLVNQRKDGSEFTGYETITPVRDSRGAIRNFVSVTRDMTESLELDERLRQTQKLEAIGTLAGGIAHDFNNLLSVILGYSEVLQSELEPESPARPDIEKISKAGHRAKELVRQILAFSRTSEQAEQPMQLGSVVKETVKMLRSTLPAMIELKEDIQAADACVLLDPTQAHQIVMNLCTNAAQAIGEATGAIRVSLQEATPSRREARMLDLEPVPHVCLTIADSGPGIPPDVRDKMFDPFFTTKPVGKGTGLGLATVHGIVTNAGGAIDVGVPEGGGTKIIVWLPIREPAGERQEERQQEPAGGSERVLVVDDEEEIAHLVARRLQRKGYHAEAATQPVEVLERVLKAPDDWDLLVLDQQMPGLSGANLVRQLRESGVNVPAIVMTGHSTVVREDSFEELGFAGMLRKPVEAHTLYRKVREAIDGRASG